MTAKTESIKLAISQALATLIDRLLTNAERVRAEAQR